MIAMTAGQPWGAAVAATEKPPEENHGNQKVPTWN
jgi:hypothetical protein